MSTHIVDEIVAVLLPKEDTGHHGNVYLCCELGGDNNVIDCFTNKRARRWSATAIGPDWCVISEICGHAGACEGGELRLRGRHTTPEGYIRAYRKAIKNAPRGLVAAAREFRLSFVAKMRFPERRLASGDRKRSYDELCKHKKPKEEEVCGEKHKVFLFDLADKADCTLWLRHLQRPAWYNLEVTGPRTI